SSLPRAASAPAAASGGRCAPAAARSSRSRPPGMEGRGPWRCPSTAPWLRSRTAGESACTCCCLLARRPAWSRERRRSGAGRADCTRRSWPTAVGTAAASGRSLAPVRPSRRRSSPAPAGAPQARADTRSGGWSGPCAEDTLDRPRVALCYAWPMAALRATDVVELLGRVPVFSTLERSDLERIAQLAVPRRFEPGQVVFREGDASDTCYVVREGRARAIRTHRDGRTITLARFGPGDIFGELALFEDERRSATVEAIEPTTAVAVLGPDMRRLMTEHGEISARLVIALGRRLRE